MANIYYFVAVLLTYYIERIVCADKPNIVVIVADDLVNTAVLSNKNIFLI